MRIIAGRYGGRKLIVPKDRNIRPTSDKVRGAVFNALQSRDAIREAHVLDLFCGTGALGLEALSRGALQCTFMDKSPHALDLARQNVAQLGALDATQFILQDCTKPCQTKPGERPATLVFLDPPYAQDLITPSLHRLHEEGRLAPDAVCVAEDDKNASLMPPPAYRIFHEKIYGDTKITYLSYNQASAV